jgi:hypothetical protein
MKRSYLFAFILLISCSTFKEKAPDQTGHYIELDDDKSVHHYDIKKTLSRSKIMAGGDYSVTAYPFTKSLVTAMANDLTFERGLSEKNRKKLLSSLTDLYLKDKTCFHVNTAVLRFEKASQLKDWKAMMIDAREKKVALTWGEFHPQIKRYQRRSSDKLIKWLNEAVACSKFPVAFKSPFTLKLTASYAPFPFSVESDLHWEYESGADSEPDSKIVPKAKKKSRTKKGYRGW